MKISELLEYKKLVLSTCDLKHVEKEVSTIMDRLPSIKRSGITDYFINEMYNDLNTFKYKVSANLNESIRQICSLIDVEIRALESQFNPSQSRMAMPEHTIKYFLPEHIKEIVVGRIRYYTDWHYPAVQISPFDGEFTKYFAGFDPLYLVEWFYPQCIDASISQFNEIYQNRILRYDSLLKLPKNQMAFAFCWQTFNHLSVNQITQYINEMSQVLLPGGTFMFSFNNCSEPNGAKHAEFGGMTYITKEKLHEIITSAGFTAEYFTHNADSWNDVSWAEIKMPGKLSTIKAHSTIGIIKDY